MELSIQEKKILVEWSQHTKIPRVSTWVFKTPSPTFGKPSNQFSQKPRPRVCVCACACTWSRSCSGPGWGGPPAAGSRPWRPRAPCSAPRRSRSRSSVCTRYFFCFPVRKCPSSVLGGNLYKIEKFFFLTLFAKSLQATRTQSTKKTSLTSQKYFIKTHFDFENGNVDNLSCR